MEGPRGEGDSSGNITPTVYPKRRKVIQESLQDADEGTKENKDLYCTIRNVEYGNSIPISVFNYFSIHMLCQKKF